MRSNTRKRSGDSGSRENGHTTPEPTASLIEPGEGVVITDSKKPPSKKRKLEDSPPWKSATTQTPTSFIGVDGRRKSGRTNPIPPEFLTTTTTDVGSANGNGATPTRPTRFSQRQSEAKKEMPAPTIRPSAKSKATNNSSKAGVNGKGKQATPTPKGSSSVPKATPNRSPTLSKSTSARKSSSKSEPPPKMPTKSSPPKARSNSKPSPAVGTRKSARRVNRSTAADSELDVEAEDILNGSTWDYPESEVESSVDSDVRIPKLKLKFSIPKPIILHPHHIPAKKEFPSFEDFLNSENPEHNEEMRLIAEREARAEAKIRNKLEDAAVNGLLRPDSCSLFRPESVPEPPRQYAHRDHLNAHAIFFHKVMLRKKKEHIELMKKRNASVMAEINRRRPRTKEEVEQEQAIENRRIYKEQIGQLRRKWEEVLREVEHRRRLRAEEEQRLAGKEHLNQMLEHSTQLLEARRGDRQASVPTISEVDLEEESGVENSEDDGGEIIEEKGEASDEDNMSISDEEDEDGNDDDENLTVEELKAKYAGLVSKPTAKNKSPTKKNNAFDESPVDEEAASDVDMDEADSEAKVNGDVSAENSVVEALEAVPELEEVDDILLDDTDESTDMNSDENDEEDSDEEEEDEGEDDDGLRSGLLGFYGGFSELTAEPEEVKDAEEDEMGEEKRQGEVEMDIAVKKSETTPTSDETKNPMLKEDVSQAHVLSPDESCIEEIMDEGSAGVIVDENKGAEVSVTTSHPHTMDVDTPTSVSQVDHKESGHPSSLTTSPETTPQPNSIVKTPIPMLLRGTLREYQHYGLDWLAGLYTNKTNGILADEMGLGKTIQTIALIAHLACEKEVWGPHLIVVPTSVMLNWEMEFKKWAPGFKILTYYGTKEQRLEKRKGWFDNNLWHVCITSYQLVLQDQVTFKRRNWHYLILDEAHNIKNFRSQRWQTLLNFKAEARLLITGTPLQNNLVELWSLLYFLMPSGSSSAMPAGFANLKEFQEWFAHPVDQLIEGGREGMDDEAKNTVTKLHQVLRPYLLRRLKADVEKQMPAKYEHVVYCRLSKRQRYLYDDFMSMAQTRETLSSGNYLSIINCLMQLRKVCNHPDLFETRQIVTSFAIQKSAVADYEIKELLVRRRLLREDPFKPCFSTDFLAFVGLVPAKNNHLSTQHTKTISALSSTEFLRRYYEEKSAAITSVEQDLSTVKGNAEFMDYQSKLSHLDKLKSCVRLNKIRTQYEPLCGSNLIEVCTDGVSIGPLRTLPRKRDQITNWFLNRSGIIREMIPSLEERTESMETIIDKFGCITPAVVSTDMVPIALSPKGVELVRRAQNMLPSDPYHKARVKLSIAFPDKRLLQYDCGKLQRLDGLLRQLQAGGHRALIFTQMTKVLDILEQFLNIHGHRYLRLDGATKVEQRQILTDRFNNDTRILAFILSTRSGGLGINLTGADTVIFYDLDWNPAMDKQCQDRCHRIGQTRDVHIYRFVSEYTIESNILRKSNQKRMLDDVVIQEGDFTTDYFNKLTIRDMLGDDVAKDLEVDESSAIGNMEKALEAAEDVEDAAAAKVAQKEVVDADGADFADKGTPKDATRDVVASTPRDPSAPATVAATTPRENIDEDVNKGLGHDIYGVGWNRIDREPDHVDDYMIRYMEWELIDVPVVLPDKSKKRNKKGKKF
ncbi:swr1 complex component [Rhizina undulata]